MAGPACLASRGLFSFGNPKPNVDKTSRRNHKYQESSGTRVQAAAPSRSGCGTQSKSDQQETIRTLSRPGSRAATSCFDGHVYVGLDAQVSLQASREMLVSDTTTRSNTAPPTWSASWPRSASTARRSPQREVQHRAQHGDRELQRASAPLRPWRGPAAHHRLHREHHRATTSGDRRLLGLPLGRPAPTAPSTSAPGCRATAWT